LREEALAIIDAGEADVSEPDAGEAIEGEPVEVVGG
jgi:hypothetical protein